MPVSVDLAMDLVPLMVNTCERAWPAILIGWQGHDEPDRGGGQAQG